MSNQYMNVKFFDAVEQYQTIKLEILEAISRTLESGQFIMGVEVELFEKEISEYLNIKHVITMNSGTDALQIALRAMNIAHGDEVITTPFSFFATAEAISHVGATPIFVDIDVNSFNVDSDLIEKSITEATKAIIPVHLYGKPCDMRKIGELEKKYSLPVLEDCAQSFGAKTLNLSGVSKLTGTIGLAGAFSFFPTKNLGAYGDGGMLVTDNDEIADIARMLRVHGARKKYHNEMVGYNSRLDSIQAAILRVKLRYIDEWNQKRINAACRYDKLLEDVEGILCPQICQGHVFHQYTIRILHNKRNLIKQKLAENGIETMIYYPIPQDQLPVYFNKYDKLENSSQLANEILSLPMYPEITQEAQNYIVENLIKVLKNTV